MASNLPRSTPEAEGIDPLAILDLVDALEDGNFETHSLMIARHGKVIAEGWWSPFSANRNHLLYSLTKSFCSSAVGFAVSEGRFGLDDLLVDHFPDLTPANPSANLRKARVRHLLMMGVGHGEEPTIGVADGDWRSCATRFLAHPVPFEPGTHFVYNTAATHMLSILIQKTTGLGLDAYITPRLLAPLGIEGVDWTRGADFTWGGSGLYAPTEAVAKLGILYLNGGKLNGVQVLPPGWAELATQSHIANGVEPENDWNQGYGFQFWRCRHNAVRGDGAFGQYCLMIPDHDIVVAITSGDCDMQKVLNAIWGNLLPGIDRAPSAKLDDRLETLILAPRDRSVKGPENGTYRNDDQRFILDLSEDGGRITWGRPVRYTIDHWTEELFHFGRSEDKDAGVRGHWVNEGELEVKVCSLNAPHFLTFKVAILTGKVRVEIVERGIFDAIEPLVFEAMQTVVI